MQGHSIETIKEKLLAQKLSLLNKTVSFRQSEQNQCRASGDEADQAASEINLNLSLCLQGRERLMLQKIEHALGKIEKGTYGECEACQARLSSERLYARPVATLCIDCKEDLESIQKIYA